jgi:hypothetical protein
MAAFHAMGCGIVRDTAGRIRLYYSRRSASEPHGAICFAESEDGIRWVKPKLGQVRVTGQDTNALRIEGIPGDADTTQPSLVQLKDGRWRMYLWAHVQKPAHYGRYVAAESADCTHFRVVNFENPACATLRISASGPGWMGRRATGRRLRLE